MIKQIKVNRKGSRKKERKDKQKKKKKKKKKKQKHLWCWEARKESLDGQVGDGASWGGVSAGPSVVKKKGGEQGSPGGQELSPLKKPTGKTKSEKPPRNLTGEKKGKTAQPTVKKKKLDQDKTLHLP